MQKPTVAAIILAAGKGTRMKSNLHKVLHTVSGKAMLAYLLDTVQTLGADQTLLVVGAGKEQIQAAYPEAHFITQAEQLGTGHAARIAVDTINTQTGPAPQDIILLYGDVPFMPLGLMQSMIEARRAPDTGLSVVGFRPKNPANYGRMITDKAGNLERIVEYKDACKSERAVGLCNSGMMVISGADAASWLAEIDNDNAAGEYYLTDLVAIVRAAGQRVALVEATEEDVMGINSREDLARAEATLQQQWRTAALEAGVTMTDPATVYFCADTKIANDVTIEPNVFFGPGVRIEKGAVIKAFSHIEGTVIRSGAVIGPFSRLRPGADIGEGAKIGNFVEVKKSNIAAGAKVNHLSYIGDSVVGEGANIGAGTITCNYDGFLKYQTTIGAGAFIGSNSALVAPVTIGDGAIVAAGSVVTKDVAANALAVARGKQREITGHAAKFRSEKATEKIKEKTAQKD